MRVKLKEITITRISNAIINRIKNLIEKFNWKFSANGGQSRAKLLKYKDIHKGKRCFLIANGPSLANMNLSCLKNEVTIGMNRIYLIYEKLGFVPTYHFVINDLVLEQFADDLSNVQSIKFYNWSKRNLFSDNDKINFVRLNLGFNDKFSTDPSKGMWSGGTVTYAALQMIYYMGFSEVNIIGLDHNFKEQGRPNKTEVRTQEKDESHFHPNYFPKGIKWQLPDLYRSELAYAMAREAFEKDGRIILDATENGKCEVFDKITFDKLKENLF